MADPASTERPARERLVLFRTVYELLSPSYTDRTEKGIEAAIAEATEDQSEGRARPVEVLEVEVIRRVRVSTRVDVVEDSGEVSP